jgi:hypothetical protein
MAVGGVRHLVWPMLLVPAILGARLTAPAVEQGEARRRDARYALPALILALVVGAAPFAKGQRQVFGIDEDRIPVRACDFMQEHALTYRVFNSYASGGYLIWRFYPQMQVFVDGRCDVYGDKGMGEYLTVWRGDPGWQDVLARHGVEMLLLNQREADQAHFFADTRWRCVYWDDLSVVALREDVLARDTSGLKELRLSNPFVLDRSLAEASPADILDEVDTVLRRDPQSWTALAARARCLVRLAAEQPERSAELLKDAFESAQRATELDGRSSRTWTAVAEVARALGKADLAEQAESKAEKFRRAGR